MPGENSEMSVIEHLEELRKRLIFIAVAILTASLVSFIFVNQILNILTCPADNLILIYSRPAEAMMSQIKLAFIAGTLLSLPFSLYQVLLFVIPALTRIEKKSIISLVLMMVVLFYLGLVFGYFAVLPFALTFFLGFRTEALSPLFSIDNYISFVSQLLFGFGIVFQLPLIFWFLGRIGVISTEFLRANRKFAILIIAIVSAILTPPDVFTQILMSIPLIILYEVGIKLVGISERHRKREFAEQQN